MKTKEMIKKLESEGYKVIEPENKKTIIIDGVEYETETHDFNKTLSEISSYKEFKELQEFGGDGGFLQYVLGLESCKTRHDVVKMFKDIFEKGKKEVLEKLREFLGIILTNLGNDKRATIKSKDFIAYNYQGDRIKSVQHIDRILFSIRNLESVLTKLKELEG